MGENKVVAVDIGGTNLRVALVRGKKILKYIKKPTPKIKKKLLNVLVSMIKQVIEPGVKGIGVGSPGPLKNGIIKNPPNLALKNFNLEKFLQEKFKKKVVVGNDANCVALAELEYGVRKNNFIILTLGTGIGGGVIIHGKIYKGQGNAGELGHIIIDHGKDFETLWQSRVKESKKVFGRVLTIKELLKVRDRRARKIVNKVSVYLGQGIASLIDAFDPEIVVLMGGAREAGRKFLRMIKKETYKFSILPKKTKIKWSKIGHPGILGAGLLVK
jgi:glucokinase